VAATLALRESRAAAQRALEHEEREREHEEQARELCRRRALEHPVPDAVHRFRESAVTEGGHGAEVGERFHHGEGGARHQ
jgi:hypothetical protein